MQIAYHLSFEITQVHSHHTHLSLKCRRAHPARTDLSFDFVVGLLSGTCACANPSLPPFVQLPPPLTRSLREYSTICLAGDTQSPLTFPLTRDGGRKQIRHLKYTSCFKGLKQSHSIQNPSLGFLLETITWDQL